VWEFHARRLRQPVPPEYLMDRVVFSQAPPLRLVECRRCGHLYRNPRERPESLREAYRDEALDDGVYRSLLENQRAFYRERVDFLSRLRGPILSGLEVGCHVGAFLTEARDAGMTFTGIDVNERACDFSRGNGVDARTGVIEIQEGEEIHDAIVIWNTFEQLPDMHTAVRAARRLLKRGGLLAVRVPNGSFYSRWRRRLSGPASAIAERVLIQNNLLGFPYRQGFSRLSMTALLEGAGFETLVIRGNTLVPLADEWTSFRGTIEERLTKGVERLFHRGWKAPWIEVYAFSP